MNKKKKGRFIPVILILTGFCLLGAALFGRDMLLDYKKAGPAVALMEAEEDGMFQKQSSAKQECLFFWDSEDETSLLIAEDMPQVLKDMGVDVSKADIRSANYPDCRDYQTVVAAFGDYSAAGDLFIDLVDWAEDGGRLMILCPPAVDAVFRSFSQKLGIQSYQSGFYQIPGIRILDDFMLHGSQADYMIEDPFESSLILSVSEDCRIYLASADQKEIPLLWSRECGKGRIVYDNIGIYEKGFRGFHGAAYSLLEDICVYPVINGMALYIDDFPAPSPTGKDFYIDRDYGISTADFYSKVWWPDMMAMMKQFGIRGTAMMIASFETETSPPFTGDEGAGKYRYYGNMVLEEGGEIGIHGFNHQPLAGKGFEGEFPEGLQGDLDYQDDLEYRFWTDDADVRASLEEAERLYQGVFAKETARVYSPPSNILSEEYREKLPWYMPEIRAVAGSYLPGPYIHDQEFEVAGDGIVETPRISSGFNVMQSERLFAVSELNLHFVCSHSVRPEDVLDTEKGANDGWNVLKKDLEQYLSWIFEAAPGIRTLSGSEFAAAVQRFYYVDVNKTETEEGLCLDLENWKDEAWFLLRMNEWEPDNPATCVQGGNLVKLQGNLYLLKAEASHVEIGREVN